MRKSLYNIFPFSDCNPLQRFRPYIGALIPLRQTLACITTLQARTFGSHAMKSFPLQAHTFGSQLMSLWRSLL